MLIWNGLTNIIVLHSVFDLSIFKHSAGQPSSITITQAGVEMPHLVVVVVYVLKPG